MGWRAALLAIGLLGASTAASAEPTVGDFLGTWYGAAYTIRTGERRIVPVQLDIREVATLRGLRRFSAQLWIRCIDRPSDVCDMGAAEVSEVSGNPHLLWVRNAARSNLLGPCGYTFLVRSGSFDEHDDFIPNPGGGLAWSSHPPSTGTRCQRSDYNTVLASYGTMTRTPPRLRIPYQPTERGAPARAPELRVPLPTP